MDEYHVKITVTISHNIIYLSIQGALNGPTVWKDVSEEMDEYHGKLETEHEHYSSDWFYVVYQKV